MRFRRRTWFAILVLLAVAAAILAQAGCGEVRPDTKETGSPAAVLGSIGFTLVLTGSICAVAGLAVSVISLFYPAVKPLARLAPYVGVAGACAVGIGITYLYIAQHSWLLLVAGGIAAVLVGWWFWPRIHRAVDRRIAQN